MMLNTLPGTLRADLEEATSRWMQGGRRRGIIRAAARVITNLENLVVMDTETTGRDETDEVVEIAIITGTGDILIDELVRPSRAIPSSATEIHGIADGDVQAAPTMDEVALRLFQTLNGKFVATYNRKFDFDQLNQSLGVRDVPFTFRPRIHPTGNDASSRPEVVVDSVCAMEMFAAWRGAWNAAHGSYTYRGLGNAVADCGLSFDGQRHRALADAKATLAVLKHIAAADV